MLHFKAATFCQLYTIRTVSRYYDESGKLLDSAFLLPIFLVSFSNEIFFHLHLRSLALSSFLRSWICEQILATPVNVFPFFNNHNQGTHFFKIMCFWNIEIFDNQQSLLSQGGNIIRLKEFRNEFCRFE